MLQLQEDPLYSDAPGEQLGQTRPLVRVLLLGEWTARLVGVIGAAAHLLDVMGASDVLGDHVSGKSKLIHRIITGSYDHRFLSTDSVSVLPFRYDSVESHVDMEFIDVPGREALREQVSSQCVARSRLKAEPRLPFQVQMDVTAYRRAGAIHVGVLVFDVTRKQSYKNLGM